MRFMSFRYIFIFVFFANNIFCNQPIVFEDQLPLVVVLMVKDEELVINPTLEAFVKASQSEKTDIGFFIFDTGSTDKTIETVDTYLKKENMKYYHIAQEPFIDFATSRNRSIILAKNKFPNSAFMLIIDAEWYFHNVSKMISFCKSKLSDPCPAYEILGNNGIDFYAVRLLRLNSNLYFKGVVHECIMSPIVNRLPQDIYFEYRPKQQGIEKSFRRWKRDADLLYKEFTKNPQDSRTTFYLAQTYECLADFYNAYKFYEIRSKQNGWHEENYETFYRLGRVADILSRTDKNFSWSMAHDYYLKAVNMSPHRAEPLLKIAEHYWPADKATCFLYARRALELPFPKDDRLFIDKHAYDFEKYEVISKCAWHVGEFRMGRTATLAAIKHILGPNYAALANNLDCYMSEIDKLQK